jgi:hypothetical protein
VSDFETGAPVVRERLFVLRVVMELDHLGECHCLVVCKCCPLEIFEPEIICNERSCEDVRDGKLRSRVVRNIAVREVAGVVERIDIDSFDPIGFDVIPNFFECAKRQMGSVALRPVVGCPTACMDSRRLRA